MAPITLKILTESGDASVTRSIRVDDHGSPADLIDILKEKISNLDAGCEYALYLPSQNGAGAWLSADKTLIGRGLTNGDELWLMKKKRALRVSMLDGTIKTLQVDEEDTVGSITALVCRKVGLANQGEYALCKEEADEEPLTTTLKRSQKQFETLSRKLKTDDHVQWLNPLKTLREQGVHLTERVLLKQKLFYSGVEGAGEGGAGADPQRLRLVYVQARDALLAGTHPVTEDTAVKLAGIQCQVEFGDYQEHIHGRGYIENFKTFLPANYAAGWGMERKVSREHRARAGLAEPHAMALYVQAAQALPTYGVSFFLVKEREGDKKKLVPRLLGINSSSILRLDENTKEILQTWPLRWVHTYRASHNHTFTLQFGRHSDKDYTVMTRDAFKIRDILEGYIDLILKDGRHLALLDHGGSHQFLEHLAAEDLSTPTAQYQYVAIPEVTSETVVGEMRADIKGTNTNADGRQVMDSCIRQILTHRDDDVKVRQKAGPMVMLNTYTVKIITLLSDGKCNKEEIKKNIPYIQKCYPAAIEALKQEINNEKDQSKKQKLEEEFQQLTVYMASLTRALDGLEDFDNADFKQAINDLANLSAKLHCFTDDQAKGRSRLLRRSRQSFIEEEALSSQEQRVAVQRCARAVCQVVEDIERDIYKKFQGRILHDAELVGAELDAAEKVAKVSGAVAAILTACSEKHVDYSVVQNSIRTTGEVLPDLIQDIKSLALDGSRPDLTDDTKIFCFIIKLILTTAASEDYEKLLKVSGKYTDISLKMLQKIGRNATIDECEVVNKEKSVGDSETVGLKSDHNINEKDSLAEKAYICSYIMDFLKNESKNKNTIKMSYRQLNGEKIIMHCTIINFKDLLNLQVQCTDLDIGGANAMQKYCFVESSVEDVFNVFILNFDQYSALMGGVKTRDRPALEHYLIDNYDQYRCIELNALERIDTKQEIVTELSEAKENKKFLVTDKASKSTFVFGKYEYYELLEFVGKSSERNPQAFRKYLTNMDKARKNVNSEKCKAKCFDLSKTNLIRGSQKVVKNKVETEQKAKKMKLVETIKNETVKGYKIAGQESKNENDSPVQLSFICTCIMEWLSGPKETKEVNILCYDETRAETNIHCQIINLKLENMQMFDCTVVAGDEERYCIIEPECSNVFDVYILSDVQYRELLDFLQAQNVTSTPKIRRHMKETYGQYRCVELKALERINKNHETMLSEVKKYAKYFIPDTETHCTFALGAAEYSQLLNNIQTDNDRNVLRKYLNDLGETYNSIMKNEFAVKSKEKNEFYEITEKQAALLGQKHPGDNIKEDTCSMKTQTHNHSDELDKSSLQICTETKEENNITRKLTIVQAQQKDKTRDVSQNDDYIDSDDVQNIGYLLQAVKGNPSVSFPSEITNNYKIVDLNVLHSAKILDEIDTLATSGQKQIQKICIVDSKKRKDSTVYYLCILNIEEARSLVRFLAEEIVSESQTVRQHLLKNYPVYRCMDLKHLEQLMKKETKLDVNEKIKLFTVLVDQPAEDTQQIFVLRNAQYRTLLKLIQESNVTNVEDFRQILKTSTQESGQLSNITEKSTELPDDLKTFKKDIGIGNDQLPQHIEEATISSTKDHTESSKRTEGGMSQQIAIQAQQLHATRIVPKNENFINNDDIKNIGYLLLKVRRNKNAVSVPSEITNVYKIIDFKVLHNPKILNHIITASERNKIQKICIVDAKHCEEDKDRDTLHNLSILTFGQACELLCFLKESKITDNETVRQYLMQTYGVYRCMDLKHFEQINKKKATRLAVNENHNLLIVLVDQTAKNTQQIFVLTKTQYITLLTLIQESNVTDLEDLRHILKKGTEESRQTLDRKTAGYMTEDSKTAKTCAKDAKIVYDQSHHLTIKESETDDGKEINITNSRISQYTQGIFTVETTEQNKDVTSNESVFVNTETTDDHVKDIVFLLRRDKRGRIPEHNKQHTSSVDDDYQIFDLNGLNDPDILNATVVASEQKKMEKISFVDADQYENVTVRKLCILTLGQARELLHYLKQNKVTDGQSVQDHKPTYTVYRCIYLNDLEKIAKEEFNTFDKNNVNHCTLLVTQNLRYWEQIFVLERTQYYMLLNFIKDATVTDERTIKNYLIQDIGHIVIKLIPVHEHVSLSNKKNYMDNFDETFGRLDILTGLDSENLMANNNLLEPRVKEIKMWLKSTEQGPRSIEMTQSGPMAVNSVLEIVDQVSSVLLQDDKTKSEDFNKVKCEIQGTLSIVAQSYDPGSARRLEEQLDELVKKTRLQVLDRLIEVFLKDPVGLEESSYLPDWTGYSFYLSTVYKTAYFVAVTHFETDKCKEVKEMLEQMKEISPKFARFKRNCVYSSAEIQRFYSQLGGLVHRLRDLCDQNVDPMSFVHIAGEHIKKIRDSNDYCVFYRYKLILGLSKRVMQVGAAESIRSGDQDLVLAVQEVQESMRARLSEPGGAEEDDVEFDHNADKIVKSTMHLETALDVKNVFTKPPEVDQPIYVAALNLYSRMREWAARDNEILAAARRMALLMAKLSTTMLSENRDQEAIATSVAIVRTAKEVTRLAKILASQCTDTRIANNLLQICDKILTISGQLKMMTALTATSLKTKGQVEFSYSMALTVNNAQNLMHCVGEVVDAAASASVKINSEESGAPRDHWVHRK